MEFKERLLTKTTKVSVAIIKMTTNDAMHIAFFSPLRILLIKLSAMLTIVQISTLCGREVKE